MFFMKREFRWMKLKRKLHELHKFFLQEDIIITPVFFIA